MKKQPKNWLYLKYLNEHKETQELEKISEQMGIEKETIVIHKVSTIGKFMELFTDILFVFLKIIFVILIVGLLSLAGTVLINTDLRTVVFDTISTYF